MESGSAHHGKTGCAPGKRGCSRAVELAALALCSTLFLLSVFPAWAGQAGSSQPQPTLPEAPQPQAGAQVQAHPPAHIKIPAEEHCLVKMDATAMAQAGAAGAMAANPANPVLSASLKPEPCLPLTPLIDWYARFLSGPQVKRLTPKQKAWLATRNLFDPFNGITVLGEAGISVAANSHSPYGPGMPGYGRYVGVSFTQDLTGEFFGTFLIPSIAHQDPHYHRLPDAGLKRRIAHAIYQVVWTQGDDGKEMVNYADVVGFAIDGAISNFYVPGQKTDLPASAERFATGLATAPIDNFITEFAPDVARRIHVHDVLVQRIINQVAKTGSAGQ